MAVGAFLGFIFVIIIYFSVSFFCPHVADASIIPVIGKVTANVPIHYYPVDYHCMQILCTSSRMLEAAPGSLVKKASTETDYLICLDAWQ